MWLKVNNGQLLLLLFLNVENKLKMNQYYFKQNEAKH